MKPWAADRVERTKPVSGGAMLRGDASLTLRASEAIVMVMQSTLVILWTTGADRFCQLVMGHSRRRAPAMAKLADPARILPGDVLDRIEILGCRRSRDKRLRLLVKDAKRAACGLPVLGAFEG
jgi:hypothetical protein